MSRADHLDPHEVKNAREEAAKCLWNMEVCEYSTEAEARARTGRKPVGLKWIAQRGVKYALEFNCRRLC